MFILEGNIGSGKSTLISILKENLPGIVSCQEPVENWQKNGLGGSLLKEFYNNPARWAYAMESFTLICRIKDMSKQIYGKAICERSIFSGFYCFAKNGYLNGFMSSLEWEIYNQWFDFFVAKRAFKIPLGVIYLRSDPKTCFERVKRRSRSDESAITYEYLRNISRMHDKMVLCREEVIPQLKDIPALVLDADLEFESNDEVRDSFISKIREFIGKYAIVPATKTDWEISSSQLELNP